MEGGFLHGCFLMHGGCTPGEHNSRPWVFVESGFSVRMLGMGWSRSHF